MTFRARERLLICRCVRRARRFSCRVWWRALQAVPYGKTASYRDIARANGNENACRAVGGANHVNPIPIVIPCHRVVGARGALTGYAGGIEIKKQLLELEQNR